MLVTEHTSDDPQFPCGDYKTEVFCTTEVFFTQRMWSTIKIQLKGNQIPTTQASYNECHLREASSALQSSIGCVPHWFHTPGDPPNQNRMNSSFQDHLRHVVVFFTPHRELHKNWQIYWRDSGTGEKLLNVRNLVGLSSMSRDLPTSTQILNGALASSLRMQWWWRGQATRWTSGPWFRGWGDWSGWGGTSTGCSPPLCLPACPVFPWHCWGLLGETKGRLKQFDLFNLALW